MQYKQAVLALQTPSGCAGALRSRLYCTIITVNVSNNFIKCSLEALQAASDCSFILNIQNSIAISISLYVHSSNVHCVYAYYIHTYTSIQYLINGDHCVQLVVVNFACHVKFRTLTAQVHNSTCILNDDVYVECRLWSVAVQRTLYKHFPLANFTKSYFIHAVHVHILQLISRTMQQVT